MPHGSNSTPQLASGPLGYAEAAGISAGRRALPAVAGIGAGMAAAPYGGMIGAAPIFSVPTGGLSIPIGAGIAAIVAGGGVGTAVNWLQGKGEEAVGAKETLDRLQQAAEQQYPKTSFAAEQAPNLIGMGVGGASVGARAVSAALSTTLEGVSELYSGEGLSPGKLLGAGASGAVFARPRAGTERFAAAFPGSAAASQ